ncbi:Membrane sulphatase, HI0842-related protein [Stigmatella aurantiaca DW4/3-1]|uniref:Membrane sulphatase, HI0842-related protein n=1 Tax=Stigmatella aurantiaca (strain DW4/3-1) TaxID=378806 RepID=Q08Q51_STIAD|nr:Membrane sulphatase, HI0842-related protein [Stigmatella aurantiaca DW4/3-1]EAU62612.1 sulfatase domain protein [Stigmatella aurantiaca DW4/3-1]
MATGSPRTYLTPALGWCLLHGLCALPLFGTELLRAIERAPADPRVALAVGALVQALFLGLVAFAVTLPFLVLRRGYVWAASLVTALLLAFLVLDSFIHASLGFHVNGLVLAVAMQASAIGETGLRREEVMEIAALGAVVLGLDVWAGTWVLRRFATPRGPWRWVLVLLLLWGGERVATAYLLFSAGESVQAAATILPLQPPVRMNRLLATLTGRPASAGLRFGATPHAGTSAAKVAPSEIHFSRRPDVVVLLAESLRADFFTPEIMPLMSRRAEGGTAFLRHYSAASSTDYSLFSLFYSLDAQRRDAVMGAGQTPLLFPVLRENGYRVALLAASSVDWMGLKDTVFRDVRDGLITNYEGKHRVKDAAMLEDARRILRETPLDQPLFLFVFFVGTHFNYDYPPRAAVFSPAWDGKGSLSATRIPAEELRARAQNAAYEVDLKIDELLSEMETIRVNPPLIIFSSDHGEEFREHGRVGHGSDVSSSQLHVPMVIIDGQLPPGRVDTLTGHIDVVPTLFSLLGDRHDPVLFGDGASMLTPDPTRYLLATVGWEPRYALIGQSLKVVFGPAQPGTLITDPDDRPLLDASSRFADEVPRLLRRLRDSGSAPTSPSPSPASP